VRRVTATKGFAGTLDGFFPWGAMQAVAKGAVFSWGNAACAKALHSDTSMSKETKTVLSGGVGGLVQGLVMSPLLLLKTRVMTDPAFRASGDLLSTARASFGVGGRIIATEGPQALFKGVTLFSLKRAADWTTRYWFAEAVASAMRGPGGAKLNDLEDAAAAFAGGALSALSTIPMDVLVAGKQSAGAAGKAVGVFDTFKEKMRTHGVVGTIAFSTKGLVARVAHVGATTLAMKKITSLVYDVL
jgi:hypothetical protein